MDWQSLGPVMATFEQIIVDGANGVTQAPRVVPGIAAWQVWSMALAVMLTAGLTVAARRWRPAGRGVALLLCLSFAPGYWQVLVRRADAPHRQDALARDVESARAVYRARARVALAALPAGACFEPSRDASCIPYGGLQDAEARHLGAARRCFRDEPVRVLLLVRHCTVAGAEVRLAP